MHLELQKGDTVSVTAYGLYPQAQAQSFWFSFVTFLANLVGQPPPPPTGVGADPSRGRRTLPLLQVGVSTGLASLTQLGNGVPKGYLRVLVFNKDSVLVEQHIRQLSQAALQSYESLQVQLILPQDGYVTAYVGNEGNVDVFFDDVTVEHRQGLQVQEVQYDPYGLELAGLAPASPGIRGLNNYRFNGKEFQADLGLTWLDYGARLYEPNRGVWFGIDPLADQMRRWSPYAFCFDNPIRFIDVDGMAPADNYQLLRDGNVKLFERTDDKTDKLFATDKNGKLDTEKSIELKKGVLDSPVNGKSADGQANTTAFLTIDSKSTSKLFVFASKNSDVEFGSVTASTPKGNTVGAVVTSHEAGLNRATSDLEYSLTFKHPKLTVKQVDHSHPPTNYDVSYPSGFNPDGTFSSYQGDRQNAAFYESYHSALRRVYVPATGKYVIFDSKHFEK